MSDIVAGLGIALVFEGLLWALAPDAARRMAAQMSSVPTGQLQLAALVAVAAGVGLVWLARG